MCGTIRRDVALYALGVGSGAGDPVEALELPFVYKHHFTDEIKVTQLSLMRSASDAEASFTSLAPSTLRYNLKRKK